MTDYKLTREEQETIIRTSAADQTWEIVTADPRIIRKMAKQGYQPDARENPWGYVSFTVPYSRVKIMRAEKRQISEKHKEALLKASLTRKGIAPAMVLEAELKRQGVGKG